ncbi:MULTISPECIES: hypothetical protein [Inquilinus]|uniref:Uncharacterized protein n=1 Tax=Inquilinus ginsengisoli TaxID=363840 RepID=A0ABU1JNN3_9PROT|nr:hypothetical protein [Inquilinus ginsengisoli]MDR6289619.1 hypothetical protein [Inquilinus ginsengisoli]
MSQNDATNEEFFSDLRALIDGWCDRRCLHLLAAVLPSYVGFNGLADDWGELRDALKIAAISQRDPLLSTERETIADLVRTADHRLEYR